MMQIIIGRILNRFTKDVTLMDDTLPMNVFEFLHVSLGDIHVCTIGLFDFLTF